MHVKSPEVFDIRQLAVRRGVWAGKVHAHFHEDVDGEEVRQNVELTLRIALPPETPAGEIEAAFIAKAREVLKRHLLD